jgi:hypothetical protein
MKKLLLLSISLLFLLSFAQEVTADEEEYAPYYKVATVDGSIADYTTPVKEALTGGGFEILGEYHPANNSGLFVICYTREDLGEVALSFEDRGALASVLKVGFKEHDGKVDISMINPMYLFYAYLVEDIDPKEAALQKISGEAVEAMKNVGTDMEPFGGSLTREDLQDYRYKIMMPYFTDPEELQEFDSFEAGLEMIRKSLDAGEGNTVKVYELVFPEREVAVFGVGLWDPEEGEADFLPVIGDDHVCALPYEMILQGNEATMLHGKYRIALHWPMLTMGTFMKIMSTPGNIEDMLEALTEDED